MIATGLDIESTGLDFRGGHRVIEIAISSYNIITKEKSAKGAWHLIRDAGHRPTL